MPASRLSALDASFLEIESPAAHMHALSIGMTTVQDDACSGLYADQAALPDADRLAGHIDTAIDELLELSP